MSFLGARFLDVDFVHPPMGRLAELLYHHRVLIFSGGDLMPANLVRFAEKWDEFYHETYQRLLLEGHPAIMRVSNVGDALEEEAFRNGASLWRTDRADAFLF